MLLPIFLLIMCSFDSYATGLSTYSYTKVKSSLQKKYRNENYVYESSDNVCLITFATYNGNDYRTSIKKKTGLDELLYCVDYRDAVDYYDYFELNETYFNPELSARLALLYYHAPKKWGEKASSSYTTGNFVLDYYMTQIVAHSLIYEFGDDKSCCGIDISKLIYKEDTSKLQKKVKALYKYCSNQKFVYNDGDFQSGHFKFANLSDKKLYLKEDSLLSSTITCEPELNNAYVDFYERFLEGTPNLLKYSQIIANSSDYDSDLQISVQKSFLDNLLPGIYNLRLVEAVRFDILKAGVWECAALDYTGTTQELGGPYYEEMTDTDFLSFDILIGYLYLYKTDSVTGEDISDAKFQIQQYNSDTKQYEFYCDMTYNATLKRFESGNLYQSVTNKEGKFKVVETSAGKNYHLDWDGQYFTIDEDTYVHEILVENEPILGQLTIQKMGEHWRYNGENFTKDSRISLPKVKYELYAKEDIYVKNVIQFSKNQKIVDMLTNANGIITVEDLPIGDYYVKEITTLDDYVLDNTEIPFSITRDENRQYSKVKLSFVNQLKAARLEIFKYYYDDKDEKTAIPLEGATFGLYIKNDLKDCNGNLIVKKDTCVATEVSDTNGNLVFDNLPYGEYYLKELTAPEGFVVNDGIVSCSLEDFTYDSADNVYVYKKQIVNQQQRFRLTVEKTGEQFADFTEESTSYGNFYTYTIGNTFLQNVTFSLFNQKKECIAKETTDEKGIASFDNLLPGTYYLSETATPEQYEVVQVYRDITLQMDNQEYNIFSIPNYIEKFHNTLCKCEIKLLKLGEQAYTDDKGLQYKNIPLQGVVYGIYQNFDYAFPNGDKTLKKDSCVGYIVTNQEGVGLYDGKLPCGNYYLKEIETVSGYEIDETLYYFDIKANQNQTINVTLNDDNVFYNELSKAKVQIIKSDSETGKRLKNVEFTLYNEKKEKIGVYKTNRKGMITVDNLPYGKYYFVETKCRDGYYSTNNKYHFELYNEETVQLKITNSPILKLGYNEKYKIMLGGSVVIFVVFLIGVGVSFLTIRKRTDEI